MHTEINFIIFLMFIAPNYAVDYYLERGDAISIPSSFTSKLQVFCYKGKPKYIIHIWQSVILQINHSTNEYTQYEGHDSKDIQQQYTEHSESWSINLFSMKQNNLKLNPFNTSCIGIASKDAYTVYLSVISLDFWKIMLCVTGVLAFLSADKLSKNSTFHYVCGVIFGICASSLILIYLISKLFPRKPFMYGVLGFGWTIIIYLLQMLWDNLRTILIGYKVYVIWYFIITGLLSFILCYRWGPVESQRTINLIKWSLQIFSFVLMYYSSHYKEAAMGQIVMLLVAYNIPKHWLNAPKSYWKKRFPPKIKAITNDEYYEQGVRETAKALEELRKYCSSPECNQWNTALKLKDVKRFASFIEGNSHLSDEEILDYETSLHGELTDDEHEDSYTDENESL